jgi:hypothetical protein
MCWRSSSTACRQRSKDGRFGGAVRLRPRRVTGRKGPVPARPALRHRAGCAKARAHADVVFAGACRARICPIWPACASAPRQPAAHDHLFHTLLGLLDVKTRSVRTRLGPGAALSQAMSTEVAPARLRPLPLWRLAPRPGGHPGRHCCSCWPGTPPDLDLAVVSLFGSAQGFAWRDAFVTSQLLHDGGRLVAWTAAGRAGLGVVWPGRPGPARRTRAVRVAAGWA